MLSVLDKIIWKYSCHLDKKVGVGSCHSGFLKIREVGGRLARDVKRLRERALREIGVVGVSAFEEGHTAGFQVELVHRTTWKMN